VSSLNEFTQLAFAGDRPREVEPCKLDLTRPLPRLESQCLKQPVIERTVLLELKRTEGMRNALDRVRDRMREVIHRIDAPRIARPMVRNVCDAIDHRIPHDEIRRCHIDLRTQNARAVRELARTHAREQVEILLHGARTVRTFLPRLGQRAAISANLIC